MKRTKILSWALCAVMATTVFAPLAPLEAKKKKGKDKPVVQPASPSVHAKQEEFKGITHTTPKKWNLMELSLTGDPAYKKYMLESWHNADLKEQPNISFIHFPLPIELTVQELYESIEEARDQADEATENLPDYLKSHIVSSVEVSHNGIPMRHMIESVCHYTISENSDGEEEVETWSRHEMESYMFTISNNLYIVALDTPEGFRDQFTTDLDSIIKSVKAK